MFQARQSFTVVHKSHELKIGFEARLNGDTTIFGLANNGAYDFGNGTVYAAAPIRSLSGTHDIHTGDPLPDTLSAFLTGTPYSFTATVGGLNFPQGDRIGESAVRRDAYNLWLADHWKIGPHFVLDYTLRYEVNTPISEGHVLGGIGMEALIANPGHSTFNAGTASVEKSSSRLGLGFQISYTFSKSPDNSSSVIGGAAGATSGPVLQAPPQDPRQPSLDKAPSTFDLTHVFTASFILNLPFDRVPGLHALGQVASGWQLLNITTLASGSPFTVFSGIQQTGLGAGQGDRPDQVGTPVLSTGRSVREDYFGSGAANGSFFLIPINVPGGTGPNRGRLARSDATRFGVLPFTISTWRCSRRRLLAAVVGVKQFVSSSEPSFSTPSTW